MRKIKVIPFEKKTKSIQEFKAMFQEALDKIDYDKVDCMAFVYIDKDKAAHVVWLAEDVFPLAGLMHYTGNRIMEDRDEY